MNDLVVPARFNGPVRSGNGGFVAGSLAERVSTADVVEVTLRRPPPLEIPMALTSDGSVTTLGIGDEVVATARIADLELDAVAEVPPDVAASAMLGYPGLVKHPFPTCFACGPDRAAGDRGHVASAWVPAPSHAESSDIVDGVQRCGFGMTWAALDCVGGWSEDLEGRPCVLGRMTARVDARPVVGEPHVVVGRHLGRDGRKSFTASTLYDADGRVVAAARHVWIAVDPSAFNT